MRRLLHRHDAPAPDEPAAGASSAAACPSAGEDTVCSDEVKHGRQLEDPAMLDGSILDVGSGIAGLMDVQLPEGESTDGRATGGCDTCRR